MAENLCAGGVEVFILQLSQFAAVHCIGKSARRTLQVEALGSTADLLIWGKGDAELAVSRRVLLAEGLHQCHDLRHAGFVVRAEQGGAIRDDEGLPPVFGERLIFRRVEQDTPLPVQDQWGRRHNP